MSRLPRSVAGYELDDVLGRGGMGEVVRARHTLLARPAALKRLIAPVGVGDAERESWMERFRREGQSLAKLRHENIVAIYDLFDHRKELWMALELVDGLCLAEVTQEPLPADVACLIALGAARALDVAHRAGIIHRDIKPANIMVSRQGVVKLMDFGVARDESLPALTETGAVVGTPHYLAPEIIKGSIADERCDIYALGATLYEMLAGQRLFAHAGPDNVWVLIARGKFPRLGKVAPHVPWRLTLLVERCLKTEPARRPQTAGELADALERIVLDAGLSTRSEPRLIGWLVSRGRISEGEALAALPPTELFAFEDHALKLRAPPWRRAAMAGWGLAAVAVLGFAFHPPAAAALRDAVSHVWSAVRGHPDAPSDAAR